MEAELAKTQKEEPLQKLIHSLNNHYVHPDKFREMQLPVDGDRDLIWGQVAAERAQGYTRQLQFGDQAFRWWVSNQLESQLHRLDIDLAGGRGLEALEGKQTHRHQTSALLEETIGSAQLAGIEILKKATREMLLKKRLPQDSSEKACINLYRTLQQGLDQAARPLTEAGLRQLHQGLTKEILKLKGVGNYRTNNKVDMTRLEETAPGYRPVDAARIPQLIPELLDWYNDDSVPFFIHPLVKAALLHYLLVWIRPFKDGNGRLARLLAQRYLLKKGYWVCAFLAVSPVISKFRTQYHKSLSQASTDGNNIGYFVQFYVQSVALAQKSLREQVARNIRNRPDKKDARLNGYNERQSAVLSWLQEDGSKVVTIRELRSVYGVSKETARTDLTNLVSRGWLQSYPINKKTYAFVKAADFDALLSENGS